ncbi:MAG: gephyrin-like molybdotransferase Glp [Desulfovibrionaceae bacterium]
MDRGFFKVRSRAEALDILAGFAPGAGEEVRLDDAAGRVLAREVVAPEDLPLADRSAMDGYAIRARDGFGATESNPAYLECSRSVRVDEFPDFELAPGECARIPTGGCLPRGADAVVMVEHTHELSGLVEVRKSPAPGEHVIPAREDATAGEPALPAGRLLRAPEAGLLAALGIARISVYARPRAAILSTGDEVVPVDGPCRPGQVRDVNAVSVAAIAREAGCAPSLRGIVPDNEPALRQALERAADSADLVVLSGGSSVGVRDVTMDALESLGAEVLLHGLSLSPGKPTILASLIREGRRIPILGLPGQAASALVVMVVVGRPLMARLRGLDSLPEGGPQGLVLAELSRNLASKQGREDFVRVALEHRPGQAPLATPIPGKSGLLRTLLNCHGLARIPAESEGAYAGSPVEVWLL